MIHETKRLLLRPCCPDDAQSAVAFYGDIEVSKFIGSGLPMTDVSEIAKILNSFTKHESEFGFSPWTVVDRQGEAIIGICGLHTFNEANEPELGFRFAKSSWGKGFATEASQKTIEVAFGYLRIPQVCALTFPENLATRAVLEKVGFNFIGESRNPALNRTVLRYEIQKD